MYRPLVTKKPGTGPKPKKKMLVFSKTEPKSPQNFLEPSLLGSKHDEEEISPSSIPEFPDDVVTCNAVSILEEDEEKDTSNLGISGAGFYMKDNEREDEYEPEEESEPEEEEDPEEDESFCHEAMESEHRIAQAGREEEEEEEEEDPEEDSTFYNESMESEHGIVQAGAGQEEEDPEEDPEEVDSEHGIVKPGGQEEDELFYHKQMESKNGICQAGQEHYLKPVDNDAVTEEKEEGGTNIGMDGDAIENRAEYVVEETEGDEETDMPEEVEDEIFYNLGNKGSHELINEKHNKKKLEVFIGGLDKNATEKDINKVFGEVGEVTDIRLMIDPLSKKNKGFAFVRFATAEQANRAVTELKNPMVNGKQCGVRLHRDDDTLLLGNICKTWTKAMLEEKLKLFGVDKLENLKLVEDTHRVGMNQGIAFLEFSSYSDAMVAYKRLQNRDVVLGVDRSAKVCFAYPSTDSPSSSIAEVKRVFLDNVPASWDNYQVAEHFEKFGEIVKIELARYKSSAKTKDFGFVTFSSDETAVACAEFINSAEFNDGDKKVKVRASLSDPLRKSNWKHQFRGDYPVGWETETDSTDAKVSRSFVPHVIDRWKCREIKQKMKRVEFRDRKLHKVERGRATPLPRVVRSYDYESPVPFSKDTTKRRYGRQIPASPRNRSASEYSFGDGRSYSSKNLSLLSRNSNFAATIRRTQCMDEVSNGHCNGVYPSMEKGDALDVPRTLAHSQIRREDVEEAQCKRVPRAFPGYHAQPARDSASYSGSKRRYSALDDIHPSSTHELTRMHKSRIQRKWSSTQVSQSRKHLDHATDEIDYHYTSTYDDRIRRSDHSGYVTSSRSHRSPESPALYYNSHDKQYGRDPFVADEGSMYSSSCDYDYASPGSCSSYRYPYSSHLHFDDDYLDCDGYHSYY